MSISYWAALLFFTFSTTITPGPNNLMLTASGVKFGFRRTLPHLAGVEFGFAFLIFCTAFIFTSFLSQMSEELVSRFLLGLKILGSGYLLWMAFTLFKTANIGKLEINQNEKAKPFTFLQATLFQFINPKAWTMAITSLSVFSLSEQIWVSNIAVILAFLLAGIFCCTGWALLGAKIGRHLKNERLLTWFNRTLALLTAGCVVTLYL